MIEVGEAVVGIVVRKVVMELAVEVIASPPPGDLVRATHLQDAVAICLTQGSEPHDLTGQSQLRHRRSACTAEMPGMWADLAPTAPKPL